LQKQFDSETLSKTQIFKWHQFFRDSNEVQNLTHAHRARIQPNKNSCAISFISQPAIFYDIRYFFYIQKLPVREAEVYRHY